VEAGGENGGLVCSARVQIAPEFQLGNYKSLQLSQEELLQADRDAASLPQEDRGPTRRYLLQSQLVSRLAEITRGEIPDTMAHERAEQMLSAFEQQLEGQGLKIEDYYKETGSSRSQLLEDFAAEAKKQLHSRLSLYELARAEGLLATEEEYGAEVQRLSEMYLMPVPRLRELLAKREEARIRQDISIAKAAEYFGRRIDAEYPMPNQ